MSEKNEPDQQQDTRSDWVRGTPNDDGRKPVVSDKDNFRQYEIDLEKRSYVELPRKVR
ncbi:hypothetical protein GW777_07410 [Candidatus Peregrinibacteria bacterium]|nr:hypothetical protein [Candidatus Peregrinibacteria bacterium]